MLHERLIINSGAIHGATFCSRWSAPSFGVDRTAPRRVGSGLVLGFDMKLR